MGILMNKSILSLVLVFFLISPTFGAKVLQKGDIAQNKGVLFTMEEEKKLRKTDMELFRIKELNALQLEKIMIQSKRIKNLRGYVESNQSIWAKVGWFSLGVLATSAALYGGVQLSNTLRK